MLSKTVLPIHWESRDILLETLHFGHRKPGFLPCTWIGRFVHVEPVGQLKEEVWSFPNHVLSLFSWPRSLFSMAFLTHVHDFNDTLMPKIKATTLWKRKIARKFLAHDVIEFDDFPICPIKMVTLKSAVKLPFSPSRMSFQKARSSVAPVAPSLSGVPCGSGGFKMWGPSSDQVGSALHGQDPHFFQT